MAEIAEKEMGQLRHSEPAGTAAGPKAGAKKGEGGGRDVVMLQGKAWKDTGTSWDSLEKHHRFDSVSRCAGFWLMVENALEIVKQDRLPRGHAIHFRLGRCIEKAG